MEKLKMHSPNLTQDNIARLRDLFPGCVTEAKGENGSVKLAVDFDQLRQELAESIVEGPQERYHLNWPGKREALLTANTPIAKTLRPCREESVDFDTTQNLFIEGDNLEALKLLQETYLGKVKMIYIDPPYNTGNDFIYNDDFAEDTQAFFERSGQVDADGNRLVANTESNGRFHSDWLSMMYSRLKLARNLLSDDGVIFISIDDNEIENIGKLCNEVFGEHNFLNMITVKTKIGGVSGSSEGKSLKDATEFIWFFAKSKEWVSINPVYIKTKLVDKIEEYKFTGKSWKYTSIITNLNDKVFLKEYKDMRIYGYRTLETQTIDRFAKENNLTHEEVYNQFAHLIFQTTNAQSSVRKTVMKLTDDVDFPMIGCEYKPIKGKNEGKTIEILYKGEQRRMVMLLSDSVSKIDDNYYYLDKVSSLWDDIDYNNLAKEGEISFSNGKKPVKLLQRILELSTDSDSLVMDFFAGSSSMADAIMQKNLEDNGKRKFIMVQIDESIDPIKQEESYKICIENNFPTTIAEISKERIRRAGSKIKTYNADKDGIDQLDTGFRVLKIDTSNMADVYYLTDALDKAKLDLFVDNIKPDRTPEDLLFQVMLDWGVDLALPIARQSIQGKEVFFVDGNVLAACFDAHSGVDEALVKELAKQQPLRVVFRDAGFKDDATKINVEQIFKLLSPGTDVKCI